MIRPRYPGKRLLLYLIPILIGMGGVRFSQELDDIALRIIVLIMSVAIPVFSGGNLLARYKTSLIERIYLFAGVVMLTLGAFVSVSGISETLMAEAMVTEEIANISRLLGMFSLLLGLFVILFSVIRTREDIEEYGGRFWHLAEHMSEGFILTAANGRITLVNKQFLEMFGLSEDEVRGKTIFEIADDCSIKNVDEIMETRSQGLPSEYLVTHHVQGEERRFWFKGKPIMDRYGHHTANLATVRDVTEQHRLTQRVERYAEGLQHLVEEQTQKLLHSEERFRQLLLSMNEGFITINAGHQVRFANATICKLLGVKQEELIGRDILNYIEAQGRSQLLSILAQGESLSRSDSRQELNLVRKDGSQVPVLLAVAFIRDPAMSELLYSLVLTSVQELKNMQHQLEQRARELELANEELMSHGRAKDSFLSNVSHELRTPLSTIQGYVEMLSGNSLGTLNTQQLHAVRVMGRNVDRIIGHINEIIDFSRMEIRGVLVNWGLFYPTQLVQECVASVHPQALEKSVSVFVNDHGNVMPIWGDREKLGQVISILLNNAVKFTEPDGTVEIEISTQDDHTVLFSVRDTGIGIDPAYHKRVFDKFFQVDASMTRKYEGTGIGLSIAKSIVESHQGRIELKSEVGGGSTFSVVLEHALLSSSPSELLAESFVPGFYCLVITEDLILYEVLKDICNSVNVQTDNIKNPYDSLRQIERMDIHCILLHTIGPDDKWLQIISVLREHPIAFEIPIVLITESKSRRLVDSSPMWSKVLFCIMPFTADALLSILLKIQEKSDISSSYSLPDTSAIKEDTPTVLIIDADPGIQEWIEMALSQRHIRCFSATSPQEAIEISQNTAPDIVFLDVNLSAERTIDHINLLQSNPELRKVPIVAMTGQSNQALINNDVDGILSKPFQIEDFVATIDNVLKNHNQDIASATTD